MVLWNLRSGRTPTGSKIRRLRKKQKFERGSDFLETRIAPSKINQKRALGGRKKNRLASSEFANVSDPKGKVRKVRIISVKENRANPQYTRRNILTLGALIETEAGLARITSRPCQSGIVNAVIVEEKK